MTTTQTSAADITAALRTLWPAPVRLSTKTLDRPGYFAVKLPSSPANAFDGWALDGASLGEGYLSRHLGAKAEITGRRTVRRRDYGRDVEFTIKITPGEERP